MILVDVPAGHLLTEAEKVLDNYYKLSREENRENFSGTLRVLDIYLRGFAKLEEEREAYMVARLKPAIEETLKAHPELRKKEKINVLMSLGSGHTGVHHALKSSGEKSRTDFPSQLYTFDFFTEGVRAYRFGKRVDNELLAHIWMQNRFKKIFSRNSKIKKSNNASLFLRKFTSLFSYDEIREIFDAGMLNKRGEIITRKLTLIGIREFPRTDEDLEKILKALK